MYVLVLDGYERVLRLNCGEWRCMLCSNDLTQIIEQWSPFRRELDNMSSLRGEFLAHGESLAISTVQC